MSTTEPCYKMMVVAPEAQRTGWWVRTGLGIRNHLAAQTLALPFPGSLSSPDLCKVRFLGCQNQGGSIFSRVTRDERIHMGAVDVMTHQASVMNRCSREGTTWGGRKEVSTFSARAWGRECPHTVRREGAGRSTPVPSSSSRGQPLALASSPAFGSEGH